MKVTSNTNIQKHEKNKNKKRNFIDWRIELARIPPMIIVVIVHMLLDAGYIEPNILSPFDWALFFSMAAFFYISGHVQGLKNEYETSGSINKTG
jgi:fucose 4-O-acetylase-like acetyltransferase